MGTADSWANIHISTHISPCHLLAITQRRSLSKTKTKCPPIPPIGVQTRRRCGLRGVKKRNVFFFLFVFNEDLPRFWRGPSLNEESVSQTRIIFKWIQPTGKLKEYFPIYRLLLFEDFYRLYHILSVSRYSLKPGHWPQLQLPADRWRTHMDILSTYWNQTRYKTLFFLNIVGFTLEKPLNCGVQRPRSLLSDCWSVILRPNGCQGLHGGLKTAGTRPPAHTHTSTLTQWLHRCLCTQAQDARPSLILPGRAIYTCRINSKDSVLSVSR